MEWRNVTFDWNRARAFLVTAEEGSLSAAARALGLAQPTLGRQVAAFEDELGVRLFDRTGHGLRLTPAGLNLVEHVRVMGDAAGKMSLAATGASEAITGPVCITASEIYAAYLLPPVLARLRQEAPGIEIELVASNEVRDLTRREADIAIRNARPSSGDLVARKLGDDRAHLYAADSYIGRSGPFDSVADLAHAHFVGFDSAEAMLGWMRGLAFPVTRANFPVVTRNHLVHWELVRSGLGIGIVPEAIGEATPGVARVVPALDPIVFPVWLIAHRDVQTSRRVRLVFDLLAQMLGR